MVHLLLSLTFFAVMAFGLSSIWHELNRPLVMQPWDNEVIAVERPLSVPQAQAAFGHKVAAPTRGAATRQLSPTYASVLAA